MKQMRNIIFLGAPGVGKGSYASRVAPRMGIPHISTGDLVRKEIADRSQLGLKLRNYSDTGQLVPDGLITEILKKRLQQPDARKGFILDGYPRTLPQAEALEKLVPIDIVLNITLDETLLVAKISARRLCRFCGQNYNLAEISSGKLYLPPLLPKREGICDKCGGQLYQREDDREEVVRERLRVYREQAATLTAHYKKKRLLREVPVEGSPDFMVPKILQILEGKG